MTEDVFRLLVQSGPDMGREYSLSAGSLTIGRYPLADIVIDNPDVGYRHALLTRGESTYRIADLGSDAGTYVNGRRVGAEPLALTPGDVILLGPNLSMTYLAPMGEESVTVAEIDAPALESPANEDELPDEPQAAQTTPEPAEPAGATLVNPITAPERATPVHPEPLPDLPPPNRKNNGRIIAIAAGCLLVVLACCCSATLFMYFIGGDWLINQLGM